MIKPVTFQGCFNFNANLYSLEVRSRFIDQSKANGYYAGYGSELAAQVVGQKIQIGTGAFLVQGRMCEITASEMVSPSIFDGFVGYVVARIETYHPSDDENCTLKAVVNKTYDAIALEQNDTYAVTADNVNTVYELPLYSFEISGTEIVNLKRLIEPIADYATIKKEIDATLEQVKTAITTSNAAKTAASDATTVANNAKAQAQTAETVAGNALTKASEAKQAADDAATLASTTKTETDQKIKELENQIGEKQGTTVTVKGVAQSTFEGGGLIDESDTIIIGGGNA